MVITILHLFGWREPPESKSQILNRIREETAIAAQKNKLASINAIISTNELKDITTHLLTVIGRK